MKGLWLEEENMLLEQLVSGAGAEEKRSDMKGMRLEEEKTRSRRRHYSRPEKSEQRARLSEKKRQAQARTARPAWRSGRTDGLALEAKDHKEEHKNEPDRPERSTGAAPAQGPASHGFL